VTIDEGFERILAWIRANETTFAATILRIVVRASVTDVAKTFPP